MDDYKINARYKVCIRDGRSLGYFPTHFGADIFYDSLKRLNVDCCIVAIQEMTDSELLAQLLTVPSDNRLNFDMEFSDNAEF